jgi:hypothetical protein
LHYFGKRQAIRIKSIMSGGHMGIVLDHHASPFKTDVMIKDISIFLLFSATICAQVCKAQIPKVIFRSDIRHGWIILQSKTTPDGFVCSNSDSTLLFSEEKSQLKGPQANSQLEISYRDIDEVHVHRAGSTWKGLGIGAASGAILGALIGDLVARPRTETVGEVFGVPVQQTITRQQYVQSGAVLGTLSGILVGALAGAMWHKTFIIQGKKEKFRQMQRKAKIIP